MNEKLNFNSLSNEQKDLHIVNAIKGLVMDGVSKANSGHPGGPMSLADFTYILYSEFLSFDPENPDWENRDRVVLSVELDAIKDNKKVWSKSFHLDEKGSGENTAMAKLVSLTLSAGIDLIIENNLQTGVQGAPSNKIAIEYFFKVLSDHLIKINYK